MWFSSAIYGSLHDNGTPPRRSVWLGRCSWRPFRRRAPSENSGFRGRRRPSVGAGCRGGRTCRWGSPARPGTTARRSLCPVGGWGWGCTVATPCPHRRLPRIRSPVPPPNKSLKARGLALGNPHLTSSCYMTGSLETVNAWTPSRHLGHLGEELGELQ